MFDTAPMRRSARMLARLLVGGQGLCLVAAIALIVAMAAAPTALHGWAAQAAGKEAGGIASWQGLALGGLMLGQAALWFAALGAMRRVFVALGALDPAMAAQAARHAARWLWGLVVYGLLAQAAASTAASWHHAAGARTLSLSLGSSQLSMALAALTVAVLARALVLGAQLWDDHRAVI